MWELVGRLLIGGVCVGVLEKDLFSGHCGRC